jgi:methylmalonyl-CoA mutase N-terminal domain/subunit
MTQEPDRETPSGIPLPPFPKIPGSEPRGGEEPGKFPFTRGVHGTMYRGRLWTMRQYSGFGTAEETNRRFRYLLEQGQSGLSVAFDLPTQIGYDSDDSEALGEVGKVGVPISTLEDMETLLEGIDLKEVSVSMTINSTAPILLAFLVALARKRGMDPAELRGTLQNDILKEFVARHTQRFPVEPSMRLVVDVLEYSTRELPRWNPISISGYHVRESGCTATEELAITFAHAIAYLEAARDRGIDVETVARRVSFFFNAQMNLFEEVAKFRAARKIWADIITQRFGVQDPLAARLRFHTQTAGAALTYQQAQNNVVRVTIQALAAILGGTQSLHTNALDEALGLPTETSARTALRTQQILAHETGIPDVADPLGGSPLIEMLTDRLAEGALELLGEVDARGGTLRAIEQGLLQNWIESSSYRYQLAVERGDQVVVGINRFANNAADDAAETEVFHVDPDLEKRRVTELRARKAARSEKALRNIEQNLTALKSAAEGSENLMKPLIACVEADASLGEMIACLTRVFGEYQGDL